MRGLAAPGLITAWCVTPVVIVFAFGVVGGWALGFRDLARDGSEGFTRSFALMLAVGLAVCGSSAAAAAHGAIPLASAPHKDAELRLTIALLNAFSMVQMILWPWVAWAAGMDAALAGAWFGGTIDGTGNVVAAGSIFDELVGANSTGGIDVDDGTRPGAIAAEYPAVEVASTVKMLQNAIIGPVAIAVTAYWVSHVELRRDRPSPRGAWIAQVWARFPKFVLGFFISSGVLSVVKAYTNPTVSDSLERWLVATRTWWFALGFVGVGLGTNLRSMARKLRGGRAVAMYLLGQAFDLLLTLAVAYVSFRYLYKR